MSEENKFKLEPASNILIAARASPEFRLLGDKVAQVSFSSSFLTMTCDRSAVVKLLKVLERDGASAIFVAGSHDVCDVLLGHRVVQVVSEDLFQVAWLDEDALVAVEHFEGCEEFMLSPAAFVPSQVDDFFKKVSREACAFVVLVVIPLQFLLFLALTDAIEAKVVNDAFKVAPADELAAPREVLE